MYKNIYILPLFLLLLGSCKKSDTITVTNPKDSTQTIATSGDPLPSWNDGALKKDIIAYVTKVTMEHFGLKNLMFRNYLLFTE